jgi:hypothetical protein
LKLRDTKLGVTADEGVNTTAKSLVRRARKDEDFLGEFFVRGILAKRGRTG